MESRVLWVLLACLVLVWCEEEDSGGNGHVPGVTGILPVANGGTTGSFYETGDILYASAGGTTGSYYETGNIVYASPAIPIQKEDRYWERKKN